MVAAWCCRAIPGLNSCRVLISTLLCAQLTDDDEALKDEEEEAQRLQREAAEQLRPEDFEQDEDGAESDASSSQDEEEQDTMGAKARQVGIFANTPSVKPRILPAFLWELRLLLRDLGRTCVTLLIGAHNVTALYSLEIKVPTHTPQLTKMIWLPTQELAFWQ